MDGIFALTAASGMIDSGSEEGCMTIDGFFRENSRAALAFSGGTDSVCLLHLAHRAGADVKAYYVKTAFQPQWELRDAVRATAEIGSDLRILEADVLSSADIASNPRERCYYCKSLIMRTVAEAAAQDGYALIIDGTNASDDVSDRPGMRALAELGVRSPLRECGITKDDVRMISRQAGLFTWDKPAYACLATRIPAGSAITPEKLAITEKAEDFLRSLGFSDFRVRMPADDNARIQIPSGQFPLLCEKRKLILSELKKMYGSVLLDLEARDD